LAHYQHLLQGAGLLWGIPKWHGAVIRRRASSPKWNILNTALMTSISGRSFSEWQNEPALWGRLVESAIGAHLLNSAAGTGIEIFYWRDHNREVDFVARKGNDLLALEVKSGLYKREHVGLKAFQSKFAHAKILIVGRSGIPLDEFLSFGISHWMEQIK